MIRPVAAALAGAFALLFFVALSAPQAEAADKRRLTIGISQYPSTLHPSFDSMMAKSYIAGMARRRITTYSPEWLEICQLCTELPSLEKNTAAYETTPDGKPGMAVTYTLKPDAVWADGVPITTRDIAFTVEVGKNPETGIDNAELYSRIDSVDILDDKSFTLHLNKRTCDYSGLAGFDILPAHIERPIFEQGASEYRHRSAYDTDPTQPGLWHGPYRVARVTPGQSILLERNPNWWGARPYFDEILVRAIENTAALTANLLSGDIDMIAGEVGIPVDQALSFEAKHGADFKAVYRPGLFYEHIDLNLDNPILQDSRVRLALLTAIDRDAISQRLFKGVQPVAHGNVNPLDVRYDATAPRVAYNPDRAAALLDEAGWRMGGNGIREKDGQPLTLTIQTTAGNTTRELVEQVLQNQWRAVGVDIRIENEPARVLFGETISKRKFTGLAMFAWLSAPESIPRTTLHSSQIPTAENAWIGQNYTGYANPEMDRIIDDLETECAETDQARLWSRLQHLYAEDLPVLPLYFRSDPFLMPKNLTGVRPTGHQYPSTLWVEEWRLND
ncbi:peptide ABC transporter substrate-binding protein [Pacificispira spongiicola]|uniref:peptide ABC transporter substrate-binding protein n=1 Tax=Pacificispira spongiicola TaxID=2729598 RepID=UPI0029CA619A|nr:peptide ABC transporter substrate-binding protein [Pacificispira spongiicola]